MQNFPERLNIATCQAENTIAITAGLADVLTKTTGVPFQLIDQIPWKERLHGFEKGKIEIIWVCGWTFVNRWREEETPAIFLAAPVPSSSPYGSHPVYFSKMIVRADSPFHNFGELKGSTLAINEPQSLSGFHSVRYFLRQLGLSGDHFSCVIMSGSHRHSIQAVLNGQADTAAIDSTLLDWYKMNQPSRVQGLRTIATIGPFPIPPLLIHHLVSPDLRTRIGESLFQLHKSPYGRQILLKGGLQRFIAGDSSSYRAIGQITKEIDYVKLTIAN